MTIPQRPGPPVLDTVEYLDAGTGRLIDPTVPTVATVRPPVAPVVVPEEGS